LYNLFVLVVKEKAKKQQEKKLFEAIKNKDVGGIEKLIGEGVNIKEAKDLVQTCYHLQNCAGRGLGVNN